MHPAPPFALAEPRIAFPALLQRAARTPLGGGREALWALWMLARLAAGAAGNALPDPVRAARATAARGWLSALSLPPALRPLVLRTAELSAGPPGPLAEALGGVIQVTSAHLDRATAAELQALLHELQS